MASFTRLVSCIHDGVAIRIVLSRFAPFHFQKAVFWFTHPLQGPPSPSHFLILSFAQRCVHGVVTFMKTMFFIFVFTFFFLFHCFLPWFRNKWAHKLNLVPRSVLCLLYVTSALPPWIAPLPPPPPLCYALPVSLSGLHGGRPRFQQGSQGEHGFRLVHLLSTLSCLIGQPLVQSSRIQFQISSCQKADKFLSMSISSISHF